MALSDRDYARHDPTQRTRFGPMWPPRTVTSWLIVICVGVFVVDLLLTTASGGARPVDVGAVLTAPAKRLPDRMVVREVAVPPDQNPTRFPAHPIVDRAGRVPMDVGPDPVALSRNGVDFIAFDGGAYPLVGWQRFEFMPVLQGIGHFSTGKAFYELQVWRLFTYQFLHAGPMHLILNCVGLYFFGYVVERHFVRRRRYLAFYLLSGAGGALLYLALNMLGAVFQVRLPGVLDYDLFMPLIGASAGVFGVLVATAVINPNATLYIFMVLPVRMRVGAMLLLGGEVYYLLMHGANAGGNAAHIGGALAGFYLMRDGRLIDWFVETFFPEKRAARSTRRASGAAPSARDISREDQILAKVHERGADSLTPGEREFLERMTRARTRDD